MTISAANSFMGVSVAASENMAIVGSPGADFFEGLGSVYRRDGSTGDELTSLIGEFGDGEYSRGPPNVRGGRPRGSTEIDLISFLPVEMGGARGVMVNDIWGWTGRLCVGGADGRYGLRQPGKSPLPR